jgi:hypothetical protein
MWFVSNRRILRAIRNQRKLLMSLQADVQKLVDDVAANKNLAQSAIAALQLNGSQIADLKAQVVALGSQLASGKPVDDEDLVAIHQAVQDMADTNAALQTAVPANTPPADLPPPTTPPANLSTDPATGNTTSQPTPNT